MIFMIFLGEELMEMGEDAEALGGTFGPSLHVSIGVTILALTLLRILWRMAHAAPPHPASASNPMRSWPPGRSTACSMCS
jgi:cytochrome b561